MHPEIISIGPFVIRSYGLLLAAGFIVGIMYAARRARFAGENPDHIFNLSVWIVFSSLIGSRLYYVVTHYSEFRAYGDISLFTRLFTEFKNMFWPINAEGSVGIDGLVLYGGLILATIVTTLYLRKHKLSVPKYMDLMAPSLGLGIFFTRIGCFLSGCCFGKPTDSIFGVCFPGDSAAGMFFPDMHIHPSQLYQSFEGLLIFFGLIFLERYKRFNGFTALLFFILYALARFVADYFRYYETNLKVFGLSHNQIISIIIFALCTCFLIYFMKKHSRGKPTSI